MAVTELQQYRNEHDSVSATLKPLMLLKKLSFTNLY
jgi:hypothetical protein